MRRLFLFVLVIVVLLLSVSCGEGNTQNGTEADGNVSTDTLKGSENDATDDITTENGDETENKEDSVAVKMKKFTIDGVNVKEFKIKAAFENSSTVTPSEFEQVYDFQYILLKKYLGYQLPISRDEMVEGDHYIILDSTRLPYTDYSIEVKDGNLYITGSYTSINTAIEEFYRMLNRSKGTLELTSDDNYFGKIEYPEISYKNKTELMSILEYLQEDDRFLFGQHTAGSFDLNWWVDSYTDAVGEGPSIMDVELLWIKKMNPGQLSMLVCQTIEYAAKGGVVTVMHHWVNPAKPNSAANDDYSGELDSLEDWKTIITKGTELNAKWHEDIDMAGEFIRMLRDAGVSVIYRPMIEANGGWFWWGASYMEGIYANDPQIVSKADMVGLWRYLHNYYTNDLGLDNVLWSYDPNVTNIYTSVPYDYYYPGEDYCDIVGVDWYTSGGYEIGNENTDWDIMLDTRKPTGLAEFGVAGELKTNNQKLQVEVFNCEDYVDIFKRMMSEDRKMAFAVVYRGAFGEPAFVGKGEALANFEYIVSLEEMPTLIAEILK